jgi:type I restriction enzyme, S subunit
MMNPPSGHCWPRKRFKFCASYNDDVLPETTEEFKQIEYVEISDVSLVGGIERTTPLLFHEAPSRARRKVKSGDILVSTVRTYLKAVAAVASASKDLIASTGFCVIRPSRDLVPAYAGWIAKSEEFVGEVVSRSVGVSYPAINASQLVDIAIPIPPVEIQRRIAGFLDEKTAQIDALIAKKQALLARLAEKRQAIITQAVTRGLNPAAPMKGSGVAWLGQIPAHWEVVALNKVTSKITNGYVGPTRDLFVDEGVRYIQSLHIKGNRIVFGDDFFVEKEWSDQHAKSVLKTNDVLVVQTGDIGQVAYVTSEYEGCNCHALIICTSVASRLEGRFLAWLFNSDYGQEFLHMVKTGALHPHLNCGNVKFFNVLIPPVSEQRKIVETVEQTCGQLEDLAGKVRASVDSLREYRSALITAAVTGQSEGLR